MSPDLLALWSLQCSPVKHLKLEGGYQHRKGKARRDEVGAGIQEICRRGAQAGGDKATERGPHGRHEGPRPRVDRGGQVQLRAGHDLRGQGPSGWVIECSQAELCEEQHVHYPAVPGACAREQAASVRGVVVGLHAALSECSKHPVLIWSCE